MAAGDNRTPIMTPPVDPCTFSELIAEVGKVNSIPDPLGIAVAAVALSRGRIPNMGVGAPGELSRTVNFHAWGAGAVALAALANRPAKSCPPNGIHTPVDEVMGGLLAKGSALASEGFLCPADEEERERERLLFIAQMVCTQTSLQGDSAHELARVLHLLELEEFGGTHSISSPYDQLFQDAYGCSAKEYLFLSYCLWVGSLHKETVNPSRFLEQVVANKDRWGAVLGRIVDQMSCPLHDVGTAIKKLQKDDGLEGTGLVQGFFSRTPYIKLGEDHYLSAPHPLLRLHLVAGAWFHAMKLARDKAAKGGSSKPWNNAHTQRMGERFPRLLENVLKQARYRMEVHPEYEYLKEPRNDKSSDLLVFQGKHHEKLILTECKAMRLSVGTFLGSSHEDLIKDAGRVADALAQIARYLVALEQAQAAKQLRPETEALSRKVLNARKLFFLISVPAMPPLFRFGEFRALVEKALETSLEPPERKWWDDNRSRITGWHVVDFDELAFFAASEYGHSLFDSLRAYMHASEFGKDFMAKELFPSFRDWLIERTGMNSLRPLPELLRMFQDFLKTGKNMRLF